MSPSTIVRAAVKVIVAGIVENMSILEEQKKKRKKRVWVRSWIKRRNALGASAQLLKEIATEDPESYRNFMRLSPTMFEKLLNLVGPKVTKSDTWMRAAISPRLKLAVTLRYLASGDSLASLEYLYRVPRCTISTFLPEVLLAIYEALADYIKVPKKKEEWEYIQRQFSVQWNFPHCCGAIDGKHVQIQCSPNSTSAFYNYKGTHSIVLFALVDAEYCFKYVEVGANGRSNDSTIFRNSELNTAMMDGSLNLPENAIIIGDDAFPLRTNLLKPYTGSLTRKQRIFNYRLSRARRVVENAFGILSSRFRIFHTVINLKESTIDLVVQASCELHNWLRTTYPTVYIPRDTVDREDIDTGHILNGLWHSEVGSLQSVTNFGINNYSQAARQLRAKYTDYFFEEGAVPWQDRMVGLL